MVANQHSSALYGRKCISAEAVEVSGPSAAQLFDQQARADEGRRRRLVPGFDAFYDSAVQALGLPGRPPRSILDLGSGTGILARRIIDTYPDAAVTLLDGSAAQLEVAHSFIGERALYVHGELDDDLPTGPWNAVVSALTIHKLGDATKRRLFRRIHEALAPGGVFVAAEHVCDALQRGEERMLFDRRASVKSQLAWLTAEGFVDADCLLEQHRFAVLVARRAG